MSRTYRKPNHWVEDDLYWEWIRVGEGGGYLYKKVRKTPTKKELALARRDKPLMGRGRYKQHCLNYVHRVRRADDRRQLENVRDLEKWGVCHFDDSHSYAFRKRVLWTIY